MDRPQTNPVKLSGATRTYERQLKSIAQHVGVLVRGFDWKENAFREVATLEQMLRAYSEALSGWARQTAANMVVSVNRQDHAAWMRATKELSAGIRNEIQRTDVGARMKQLLNEQVHYIKSIPLDAAQRVHDLTLKGLEMGARPEEIAAEINRTGQVSRSKALLIARTEVGRTSTVLTQTRAESIGSEGYIWRTSGDESVRPSHKKMNGRYVPWRRPPTLDNLTGHAGALVNCRCYPESVIPN